MATGGLYGASPNGNVVASSGSESSGLYGNSSVFGGTYFEYLIFIESITVPSTPTGGSWSFTTNIGTPPTGWSNAPPASPTNPVYLSIALVNSRGNGTLTWSVPGQIFKQGATGPTGPTGPQGPQGTPGAAATITAGTTTTGAAGTSASVNNSGTSSAAVFNFTIPRGDTGATGATGTAATVAAGTTTTGAAGTSASVTNSGTSSAAVFNFTIPRGDTGATGAGVPTGGTAGQVLSKIDTTNYNTQWITPNAGTVTSVGGTGSVNGLTLTGAITTSGNLTLGGVLDLSSPPVIGGTSANIITGSTINANVKVVSPDYYAQSILGGNLRTSGGTSLLNWDGGGSGNITINGGLSFTASNKNATLSPTGTGTVTINPATSGAIDNVAIGVTTALAGTFTTLRFNTSLSVNGSTGTSGQVLTSSGSGLPTWTTPTTGSVTSVSGTGTVNGLTLTGTVTSSGSLTLGGTLNLSSPPVIGNTTPAAITGTTIKGTTFVGISGGTF